jgi:uncharacterized protein (TIGR00251 family)
MTIITVKLTPSAKKNEIKGWETNDAGERYLRASVTAAPEKGNANKALIKLLAKNYDVSKSTITLLRGDTSRIKTLEISGLSYEKIQSFRF